MPVPRRFDRRPPDRDTTRINERIRVPEVRLIGDDGAQIGVLKTDEAIAYAAERDLDLVEVAPEAKPPVCRALDYSKYKYEQEQKLKQARKHQQQITVREIKFRPKIAQHDYETKKGHVVRFLKHQDKVKVTIMFRGREVTHPERGEMILTRLAEELGELAIVEQRPTQDGRNMTMMLGPQPNAGTDDAEGEQPPESEPGMPTEQAAQPAKAEKPEKPLSAGKAAQAEKVEKAKKARKADPAPHAAKDDPAAKDDLAAQDAPATEDEPTDEPEQAEPEKAEPDAQAQPEKAKTS